MMHFPNRWYHRLVGHSLIGDHEDRVDVLEGYGRTWCSQPINWSYAAGSGWPAPPGASQNPSVYSFPARLGSRFWGNDRLSATITITVTWLVVAGIRYWWPARPP